MLRLHHELDGARAVVHVHRDFDLGQPLEQAHELLGFFLDKCLCRLVQMSMSCRDLDLHRRVSFRVKPPGAGPWSAPRRNYRSGKKFLQYAATPDGTPKIRAPN